MIYVSEITEIEMDLQLFSDMHKDAYGIRPNQNAMRNFRTITQEQRDREFRHLQKVIEQCIEVERKLAEGAVVRLKADIVRCIEHPRMGLNNWKDALFHILGRPKHRQDFILGLFKNGIEATKAEEIAEKFYGKGH